MNAIEELEQVKPDAGLAAQPLRASDPQKALAMVVNRQRKLNERAWVYQAVEDAYDRMPTDSKEALELDGLGWTSTIDWGGMKAGIDAGALTDYNLMTQPETYVRLVPRADGPGVRQRLDLIERAHKEVIDGWSGWLPELEQMVINRRAHGLGVFHFPNPVGWHFKSLHPSLLIYPPNATLNVDDWPWFALRTEFRITDMLRRAEDPEASAAVGWKLENVRAALRKLEGGDAFMNRIESDLQGYLASGRADDLWFAESNKNTLPGWQLYVQEWDGTVSEHFLVNDEKIGFLFSGPKRHAKMSDTLALFPLSMAAATMDRLRGYGLEMLPFHDTENRARNHLLDQFLTRGVVLKSVTGDDSTLAMTGMKHHGPFIFMNGDIELASQQLPDTTGEGLRVLAEMERTRSLSNRALGGNDQSQRNSDMSATQSRILYQTENAAESNEVARLYRLAGHFHKLTLRRMLQPNLTPMHPGGREAVEMVSELLASGVTVDDFSNIKVVKPRTIFGDGNPVNQFLALQDLRGEVASLPVEGQRIWRHTLFASRLRDPEMAAAMTLHDGRVDAESMDQRWAAQMENNVFETSDTRQDLGSNDHHVIHGVEHTVYAEEVLKRPLELQEQFERVERARNHMTQHLELMAGDEHFREPFKDLERRWANLANWQRQAQQRLGAETQKKQAEEMEELRNPRPKVKDAEVAMTEQLKRDLAMRESEQRMKLEAERHGLEVKKMLERRAAGMPTPMGGLGA
jgi:hypothetical protein